MPRHTQRPTDRQDSRDNHRSSNRRQNDNRRNRNNDIPEIFDDFTTLTEKLYAPVNEFPTCNFTGQLFGFKGSNIKQLVASTHARISILGRGSTKDMDLEQELAESGAPEHEHFKEPLHVVIQIKAPRIAAHRRMANALKEVQYWLVPRTQISGTEHPDHYGGTLPSHAG